MDQLLQELISITWQSQAALARGDLTGFQHYLEQRELLLQAIGQRKQSAELCPDSHLPDPAQVSLWQGSPELWQILKDLDQELLVQASDQLESWRQSLCLVRKQRKLKSYTSSNLPDRPYLNQLR